jgi:hypothetical protein
MSANGHKHTENTSRELFGNTLSECECGARKNSNGKAIAGSRIDSNGWYVRMEEAVDERIAYNNLQTEGYGYGSDPIDLLDSHFPNID